MLLWTICRLNTGFIRHTQAQLSEIALAKWGFDAGDLDLSDRGPGCHGYVLRIRVNKYTGKHDTSETGWSKVSPRSDLSPNLSTITAPRRREATRKGETWRLTVAFAAAAVFDPVVLGAGGRCSVLYCWLDQHFQSCVSATTSDRLLGGVGEGPSMHAKARVIPLPTRIVIIIIDTYSTAQCTYWDF